MWGHPSPVGEEQEHSWCPQSNPAHSRLNNSQEHSLGLPAQLKNINTQR